MRNLTLILMAACSGSSKPTVTPPAPAPEVNVNELSVLKAMKPEVNACTDFYDYACGGWRDNTKLPADKPVMVRSFTTIHEENQRVVRAILDEAAKAPGDDPVKQKLGAFYGACMDTAAIDALGAKPLEPWFERIKSADRDGLFALAGEITAFGPNPWFGTFVSADDKNPTMNLLQVSQAGLGLPDRDYYLDLDEKGQQRLESYQTTLKDLLVLSGVDAETAEKEAEQVVEFETALAAVQLQRTDLRDSEKTYNKMSLDDLKGLTPSLPFDAYFKALGMGSETVNVRTPAYFEGLEQVLTKTDTDILRAYLRAQLVTWAAPYLNSELDQRSFAFFGTELSGQKQQKDRWKRCVQRTEGAMGEWLGKSYVAERFAGDSKQQAEEMVAGIFKSFEANLANVAWMDDATRERAKEKSRAFIAKLGYPDEWRDYSALEVDAADHFSNVARSGSFNTAFQSAKVDQPVDKGEWHMLPQTVNAYYNPPANEIVFPAGIMQAPFFDRTFPKAMNYGALGMVIGHELTHGFDDEGRKYAPTGELKEWWSPEITALFEEKAECVDDQYSAFEVQPDLHVNGKLTLGENIADIGGLKMTHLAYRDWVASHNTEPKFAGLEGDQVLFLAFAQSWCTLAAPEIEEQRVKTDPHSPPRFRVNGTLMNYPAFAEAFSCDPGTPMNPTDRCEVW